MTARDLIEYVVSLKGAALNADEGVLYGDPGAEVRGVLVTWMPTVRALTRAAECGCNVVLCHERFYFVAQRQGMAPQQLAWAGNRNRLAAAARGQLAIVRVHGSLDMICIWDDFVAALGVEDPNPGTGWNKVLPIEETSVADLVADVKARLGVERVRVAGDLSKIVRVAGFPWGGLGLDSNIAYVAKCIDLGAQVLIAGEADEYGMTFALDSGVPLIETGHALSENIGLQHFSARLAAQFEDVRVEFFPDTCAYVYR